MRIAGLGLYRYVLPFSRPLNLKGATLRRREGLLLRLSGDDGSEGWGETAPLPGFNREGLQEAAKQLRGLAGTMMHREVWGRDGELGLGAMGLAPSVRFGFELALWNLRASSSGETLPGLLAPHPRAAVPVNGLLLSGPPGEVLEEARRMGDSGYEAAKLKVGGRAVEEDVALVRALGEGLGDVALRLDANRAWGYEEAAGFVRGVAGSRYEYLEEPLADPGLLPRLVRESGAPVALDESLVGIEPEELQQHPYARAVVLKPTLVGGISLTMGLAERALRLGMTPVISSAYESGVGTAALVALAAAIGERPVPAGLDTYRRLAEDVLETPLDLPAPSIGARAAADASRAVDAGRLEEI